MSDFWFEKVNLEKVNVRRLLFYIEKRVRNYFYSTMFLNFEDRVESTIEFTNLFLKELVEKKAIAKDYDLITSYGHEYKEFLGMFDCKYKKYLKCNMIVIFGGKHEGVKINFTMKENYDCFD